MTLDYWHCLLLTLTIVGGVVAGLAITFGVVVAAAMLWDCITNVARDIAWWHRNRQQKRRRS